jgi:hypothetical protein
VPFLYLECSHNLGLLAVSVNRVLGQDLGVTDYALANEKNNINQTVSDSFVIKKKIQNPHFLSIFPDHLKK